MSSAASDMFKPSTLLCINALCAIFCCAALLAGCASKGASPAGSNLTAISDETADDALRANVPGSERGLEVRQWLVADDTDRIAAVMAARSEAALTGEQRKRLTQNGLRLVRVPLDQLDAFEAELGGSTVHNTGWHGQIIDWQELLTRSLPQQRAIAVDGRVRLFEPGRLRLMTRAWVVQLEDGVRLNVQIVPQHFKPAPMTYYRLLGRDSGEGTPVASMAIDVLLEEGFAYALTCESPAVDWRTQNEEDDKRHEPRHVHTVAGPDAPATTTVGQFLLMAERGGSARPGRAMLILVPHIFSPPEPHVPALMRSLPAESPGVIP